MSVLDDSRILRKFLAGFGKTQGIPALTQLRHGSLLLHLTFLWRQVVQLSCCSSGDRATGVVRVFCMALLSCGCIKVVLQGCRKSLQQRFSRSYNFRTSDFGLRPRTDSWQLSCDMSSVLCSLDLLFLIIRVRFRCPVYHALQLST